MFKLILLLVVGVVIYLLWRASLRKDDSAPPRQPQASASQPERMVSCAACALHVPESEALKARDGRFYCCHEHFENGQQPND